MPDILGRMFAFLMGVVMMFMVPLTIIMLKQDDTKQALIDDTVVEFVDNARASGEITPTAYMQFVKKINDAHGGCDISIVYESALVTPDPVEEAGTIKEYGYKRNLQAYTEQEITNTMYYETDAYGRLKLDGSGKTISRSAPMDFELKEGGYLTVKVTNRKPTPGTQMLRMFLPRYNGKAIIASYGGYVGNNKQ